MDSKKIKLRENKNSNIFPECVRIFVQTKNGYFGDIYEIMYACLHIEIYIICIIIRKARPCINKDHHNQKGKALHKKGP